MAGYSGVVHSDTVAARKNKSRSAVPVGSRHTALSTTMVWPGPHAFNRSTRGATPFDNTCNTHQNGRVAAVLHLFDANTGWEQRVAVGQLLARLPADRYRQLVSTIDSSAIPALAPLDRPIHRFPHLGMHAATAPIVSRYIAANRIDLIHTWGPQAAAVAAAAGAPTVLELFDPALAARSAKWIRTVAEGRRIAVIGSGEWVRRRLIEGGVQAALCRVIRPGVDFAHINAARKLPLRTELGIPPTDMLIMTTEPRGRAGGEMDAFWAAALANRLAGGIRVIVPGRSAEQQRIADFAAALPAEQAGSAVRSDVAAVVHRSARADDAVVVQRSAGVGQTASADRTPDRAAADPTNRRAPSPLICPGDAYRFEDLLPHADVLIVAPEGDVSTTAIAWAMGAKVAILGSAVHAITELVAHKVGGLLFKKVRGRPNPIPLVKLINDREAHARTKEAAHGMAYESFGLRRYVDEHTEAYESLLSPAPVSA